MYLDESPSELSTWSHSKILSQLGGYVEENDTHQSLERSLFFDYIHHFFQKITTTAKMLLNNSYCTNCLCLGGRIDDNYHRLLLTERQIFGFFFYRFFVHFQNIRSTLAQFHNHDMRINRLDNLKHQTRTKCRIQNSTLIGISSHNSYFIYLFYFIFIFLSR